MFQTLFSTKRDTLRARIPVAEPNIGNLERKYLLEAYDSTYISGHGPFIDRFEEKFSEFLGIRHSVACSSGTTALHLAVLTAKFPKDEKIYVTKESYVAASNAIRLVGGIPFNAAHREYKYGIAVHNYGFTDPLLRKNFIEDCAEALGSRYGGQNLGTIGISSIFSFYANKTITTGEGGMFCTNNSSMAKEARHLRSQAMVRPYFHDRIGFNYRMTNLQAAIGCAQLERVHELIDRKLEIAETYTKHLECGLAFKMMDGEEPVPWMNVIKVENTAHFAEYMDKQGIETRPGFADNGLVCLPSGTTLSNKEVLKVCEAVNVYTGHHKLPA